VHARALRLSVEVVFNWKSSLLIPHCWRLTNWVQRLVHDITTYTSLTVGDLVQVVALPLTLVVAWLTVRRASFEQRREKALEHLLDHLSELDDVCADIASDIHAHLIGKPANMTQLESQRKIGTRVKAAGALLQSLKYWVPESDWDTIEKAFHTWHRETQQNYPIQNRAKAFKEGDFQVVKLDEAQAKWAGFLSKFKSDCVHQKIKFWKPWKQFWSRLRK
jgi:hypothetical protein